ncbi:hypothetical protein SO802_017536 [Lithocarpus litseifolius]|uniref:Uncharacterized protein n=1 Tax=Lithocarpus litseifolius TaxID=425828 RepID=A0AAW2CJL9_9ROSI
MNPNWLPAKSTRGVSLCQWRAYSILEVGVPLVVDPGLEAFSIISFAAIQPLKGVGLRVLYLAEKVSCQLMGLDTPQDMGGPVDPSHLPWSIYTYGPDGFTREHLVGCNPNFMGYPFPPNTRVVSSIYP